MIRRLCRGYEAACGTARSGLRRTTGVSRAERPRKETLTFRGEGWGRAAVVSAPIPLRDTGRAVSENLDIVRSIVAAHERGDYSSAEWAHPDIEYLIADGADAGLWTGRAAMAKAWGDLLSAYTAYRSTVEEMREIDAERVLVLGSFGGMGKASGIGAVEGMRKGAALYQVREGIVIRHVVYFERDRALADLGLKE
jgi:hypothetical protein